LACRDITVLGIAGQSFDVTWREAVSADVASARDLPGSTAVAMRQGVGVPPGAVSTNDAPGGTSWRQMWHLSIDRSHPIAPDLPRYRQFLSAAARKTGLDILTANAQPVDRSREGVGQIVDA
jgi:hypothetical protein